MKKRNEISKILKTPPLNVEVTVMGWVRAFRSNRFIALYDGSSAKTLQIVVPDGKFEEALLKKISFHACISATGKLVESQGAGQTVEVLADSIEILGESNPEAYPMQPKTQTMEFLREKAHFRMRTATFSSVFRIRHGVAYAIHKYYNDRGFYYLHSPIITGSDAEGAGEMFRVTTFDLMKPAYKNEDFDEIAEDFYKKIEKSIKQDNSENFRKILQSINKELPLVFEDYNFERLVTASSFEIEALVKSIDYKSPLINSLKQNFRKLYENLKAEIFEKGSKNSNYYLPKELSEKIMKVSFEKDKNKKLIVQRQFSIERFPIFCFCFYNITAVQRRVKLSKKTRIDYEKDFFEKATNLTVSGQLQAEIGALALGKVYTFGPTFRAENSNTSRHLAEFWMIEPEVAFYDIDDDMDLAEDFVKYLINYVLENFPDDVAFLDQRIKDLEKNMKKEERRYEERSLTETLRFVVDNSFERITYTEAVELILNSKEYKKGKFEFELQWGKDLQAEHERWLVEKHFQKPVIVRNYPKDIKAFYMRMNEDGKTVAAMDVLFPGIGEVIGGSQREERYDVLVERIHEMGIDEHELWWYLELRKFGGCPHAGFGLGFERMVQFITGMGNIRDVIPFPRTPGNAEF